MERKISVSIKFGETKSYVRNSVSSLADPEMQEFADAYEVANLVIQCMLGLGFTLKEALSGLENACTDERDMQS